MTSNLPHDYGWSPHPWPSQPDYDDDTLVTCEGCTHSLPIVEAFCTEDGCYLCPICADCEGDAP
jgi:hypothetical protein